ncbi:MAG: hypothetical protein ABIX10_15250 [Acidimicrobiales bacterium]
MELSGDDAITIVGEGLITERERVWLAYAAGELVDSGAHPPYGYPVPTGGMGYLAFDMNWSTLGGGLLVQDRSSQARSLGSPVKLPDGRR